METKEIPDSFEYKIVILGDESRGESLVMEYLEKMILQNENKFKLNLHIFNIKLSEEDKENKTNLDKFNYELIKLLKLIQNGVHLILICFPLTTIRADISHAGQVYRLLGTECSDNLLAILTEYDKLNENNQLEISFQYLNSLSTLMMKNVMPLDKENIIIFNKSNPEDFYFKIIEKVRLKKNFEYKFYTDVEISDENQNSITQSLILLTKKENFNRFIKNLPEIKQYIEEYQNEIFSKNKMDSYIFDVSKRKYGYILLGISLMIGIDIYYETKYIYRLIAYLKEKIRLII